MSRRASALEGLNDDQAPAAARARMRERLGFSLARGAGIAGLDMGCLDVEQLTRLRDVVGASGVCEEAGDPSLLIVRDAAARHDDVDVRAMVVRVSAAALNRMS